MIEGIKVYLSHYVHLLSHEFPLVGSGEDLYGRCLWFFFFHHLRLRFFFLFFDNLHLRLGFLFLFLYNLHLRLGFLFLYLFLFLACFFPIDSVEVYLS